MSHQIALFGNSVTLASIGEAIRRVPGIDVVSLSDGLDGKAAWPAGLNPDAILFDMVDGLPDRALQTLAGQRGLVLIGLDLAAHKMLVLSGQPAQLFEKDDLLRVLAEYGEPKAAA